MQKKTGTAVAAVSTLVCLVGALSARAQDLEPRAYAASPANANFLLVNYSYQSGDVLFDPSLPFSNAIMLSSGSSPFASFPE